MKIFGWEWKVLLMKTECLSKFLIFHFKCTYFGQQLSKNSIFWTTYIRKYDIKVQLKLGFLQHIALHWSKLTKISDNSNNFHFSGIHLTPLFCQSE